MKEGNVRYTERKHKERITSTAMKIPWENSALPISFPFWNELLLFFFLFNKYTYILYTYELHLKLFNKITTLKKPHTFPRESRKTDPVLTHQKYCQIHRIAQSHRTKKTHTDEQHVANL